VTRPLPRPLWNRVASWARTRIHGPIQERWYRHECAEGRGLDTYMELRDDRADRQEPKS
jgi:hypothetical protein